MIKYGVIIYFQKSAYLQQETVIRSFSHPLFPQSEEKAEGLIFSSYLLALRQELLSVWLLKCLAGDF